MARSASHSATLHTIAAAAGDDSASALNCLASLSGRGRCSTLAAAAAQSQDLSVAVRAARHRAFAPPAAWAASLHPDAAMRCCAGPAVRRWSAATRTNDAEGGGNRAIATRRHLPAVLLRRFVREPFGDFAFAVAANTGCPGAALNSLATSHLANAAAANTSCPPAAVAAVAVGAHDGDPSPRWAAVGNTSCPGAVLASLVRSRHEEAPLRRRAADNSNCPPDARADRPAAATEWDRTSEMVSKAEDRQCPAETLKRLGAHDSWWVRQAVAEHPNCPQRRLAKLATDDDEDVRSAAAANPQLAAATVRRLLDDLHWRVREAAASNPALGLTSLAQAVSTDDTYTRRGAARNPCCSLQMILDLSEDDRSGAMGHALATLADLPRWGGADTSPRR